MYCPYNDETCRCGEFCIASIWSTPRNAGTHGRQIRRVVDHCAARRDKAQLQASRRLTMTDYEFTLKFSLPASVGDADQYIEALAVAGCDDALIGIGQNGRIALDFTRGASSAFKAISTALRDVRAAIPGAMLVEAAPDFVGLTDVADIAGFTRQNMRKLMLSNMSTFPVAIHEGKPALWHLATILTWLHEQQKRPVDGLLLEIARTNMTLNIAKETRKLPGAVLPRDLDVLFA